MKKMKEKKRKGDQTHFKEEEEIRGRRRQRNKWKRKRV